AIGASNHNRYATLAPNAARSGRRSSSTSTIAALLAQVLSSSQRNTSACVIVDLLQQAAQFGDIGLAQPAALAEMRHQRGHAPIEQALQQAFALLRHPGLARQDRRIQVAAALPGCLDRALVEQTI